MVIAVACRAVSGARLWRAQKTIPIGTAYAVWTGMGAAGTFIVGILSDGDSASAWRRVSVGLIVAGIIGLKRAYGPGSSGARSSNRLHVFITRPCKARHTNGEKDQVGVAGVGDALTNARRNEHPRAQPDGFRRPVAHLNAPPPLQDQRPPPSSIVHGPVSLSSWYDIGNKIRSVTTK